MERHLKAVKDLGVGVIQAWMDEHSPQAVPMERLARIVQSVTDDYVEIAWVDQGHVGERDAEAAARQGLELKAVKLPEARRGFILLPRRWVVERSFAWATCFRCFVKD